MRPQLLPSLKATTLLIAATIAPVTPVLAEVARCDTAEGRSAVIETLPRAAEDRPVHITFDTSAEGVRLPAWLVAQYPNEMTVILQYQFERLVVRSGGFDVTVRFKGQPLRLTIPFDAVKGLWDNSIAQCGGT
jgi:hypothetical protein